MRSPSTAIRTKSARTVGTKVEVAADDHANQCGDEVEAHADNAKVSASSSSPAPPAGSELLVELRSDEDGGPRLRAFAHMADRESAASRWAFHRDFGKSRLVVVDSRAARVLADGRRDMVDAEEWDWIVEHARGSYDHLIIASTLPVFMTGGIHELEAWNEAVCAGVWGGFA
jgi:hypothetical protein